MPVNQLLSFALDEDANVLTPAEYAALTAQKTGFKTGVASSKQLNTIWRQTAFVAAMIGQFICDTKNIDVKDDGDIETLESNFIDALKVLINNKAGEYLPLSGGMLSGDIYINTSYSKTLNGYTRLPNGFIEQWGYIAYSSMTTISGGSASGEKYATVTFPISFNTAINPQVALKAADASIWCDLFPQVVSMTNTTLTVKTATIEGYDNRGGTDGIYWRVIGY